MASFWYNTGLLEIADGTIDLDNDTLKLMLVEAGYVPDRADDVVDAGGANDAVDHEISVANYTAGWGGTGRKTPTITLQANDTDDRVDIAVTPDPTTWTALGAGATVAAVILIKEGVSNDTTSRLIAYFDTTDFETDGEDVQLNWAALAAGGNLQIKT